MSDKWYVTFGDPSINNKQEIQPQPYMHAKVTVPTV